ncbi:MAG: hypothetical protein H0X26_06730 [Alphaproteobacteria bacterium]|nr:hypothetical protein [Alphaproteobacteria bacterium]
MHNFIITYFNVTYFNMAYLKTIFFALPLMVIGTSRAWAVKETTDLALSVAYGDAYLTTDAREFVLGGDTILLIGFLLWIVYVVFSFPNKTFKKL